MLVVFQVMYHWEALLLRNIEVYAFVANTFWESDNSLFVTLLNTASDLFVTFLLSLLEYTVTSESKSALTGPLVRADIISLMLLVSKLSLTHFR